jgi:hypothetical protein
MEQVTLADPPVREDAGARVSMAVVGDAPLAVVFNELSPTTLIRANTAHLQLFAHMRAWGLGAPTHVAAMVDRGDDEGEKLVVLDRREGEALPDAAAMSRPWLLCWFHGADNWSYWDAPMLVVLQHRPASVRLDAEGLHLTFGDGDGQGDAAGDGDGDGDGAGRVGDVVLMPLYGYDKIPLDAASDFRAAHGLASRGLHTDAWAQALPREVIERCDAMTSALRALPMHCRETFALDGDDLVIRMRFEFHTIADDWDTAATRIAPLPLALAWWAGEHTDAGPFPMTLSGAVRDMDVFTAFGPWAGVEGVDEIELRLPVLQYVRQYEPAPVIDADDPLRGPVLDRLRRRMNDKFTTGAWEQIWDHELNRDYGGPGLYCWQVMNDRWYAKALAFVEPQTREKMASTLKGYLENWILDESHYQPFRDMLLLVGPGIGTWGSYDDAGKFSSNLLDTIWHFAFYLDHWQPIREHWPMLKRFFITPLTMDWKSVGRHGIAEMGDEAPPPLAYARMAYAVGDMEEYAFGCYVFARELVHHYVKQVGQHYFLRHQPFNSMEAMQPPVWLTNLYGDVAGWQIDGPTWPAVIRERQSGNRWVRFSSYETARFYRDVLKPQVREELDELTAHAREHGDDNVRYKIFDDSAHITPGLVRLRAMLLDESPEALLEMAPLGQWGTWRAADIAAQCIAVLRVDVQPRYAEIIPPLRTNHVLGLERVIDRTPAPHTVLGLRVPAGERVYPRMVGWPTLIWRGWRPPMPVRGWVEGRWWSFGQIIAPGVDPADRIGRELSWNGTALLYGTGATGKREAQAADGEVE